jgi:hypothetical protein
LHGPRCCGTKRNGEPCNGPASADFAFEFCVHHPRPLGSNPTIIRIDDLRNKRRDVVTEYRGGKDAYTEDVYTNLVGFELDHVVELHVARDAFDKIKPHGTDRHFAEKKKMLIFDMTESVNATENLNFTTKEISHIKFEGNYAFLGALKLYSNKADIGLVPFLLENNKLSREQTRSVGSETKRSARHLIATLDGPDQTDMADELQVLLTAMKL